MICKMIGSHLPPTLCTLARLPSSSQLFNMQVLYYKEGGLSRDFFRFLNIQSKKSGGIGASLTEQMGLYISLH